MAMFQNFRCVRRRKLVIFRFCPLPLWQPTTPKSIPDIKVFSSCTAKKIIAKILRYKNYHLKYLFVYRNSWKFTKSIASYFFCHGLNEENEFDRTNYSMGSTFLLSTLTSSETDYVTIFPIRLQGKDEIDLFCQVTNLCPRRNIHK